MDEHPQAEPELYKELEMLRQKIKLDGRYNFRRRYDLRWYDAQMDEDSATMMLDV